ncbi:cysteine/serine-rich nuclear protein 1 [Mesocricetus auratus]|uniref:Cysteine/serine-rich nuclear protein 1 n=1 Tax=Mesocricetus auratus TaxID=10036 RepID=A0ABM2WYF3_MESAU|nr:cysteine/serine-rich nuclear protein 1 [Mesocricetus auratus]XP_040595714.1 cysteine/serine-rich nuclear protein 1 [Mesocricetus auratus]XP_040595715.1 cysteine/serine-rich nuclear protein 1 [Mesocricetus auratus]XP_040595716.1 cysteine/serine-rich nuclear protein 1 [Mesocricetus auratus]
MAGLLKRKFDQLEEDFLGSSSLPSSSGCLSLSSSPGSSVFPAWNSDEEGLCGQAPRPDQDSCGLPSFTPPSILKRSPRERSGRVTFDGITVYYFPRCQGFTSVPSRGGCTLGMAPRHSTCRLFSLAEFTQEQVRARREKLRQRLKEEKLERLKWKLSAAGVPATGTGLPLTVDAIDDASVENDLAVAVAGGRLEDVNFLQPHPPRQRRALLRASGVRRIDREEKRELQALRLSREDCGCRCDGVCDPETCSCSLAGIKCQMDHTSFPCGCCREGCENPNGRVEFNQTRVQTHFIHTLTRLQMEQGAESLGVLESPVQDGPIEQQTPVSPFPLANPPVSSELGDNSCSSDMTDSSTSSSSGNSEPPDRLAHPSPPGPGFQSGVDEDSLAQILNFSDSDFGVEEEEEEEEARGVGSLDNLSCFHLADIFSAGDPSSLAGWTHGQSYSTSLAAGILDENANLDASCFLHGGLEGLSGGSLPGSPGSSGAEAVQSGSVDLSLSSCDSFEFFQALPDYSLGPHYTSRRVSGSLDSHEAPHLLPSFSPPRDASTCFLESLVGLSEPVTDVLAPLLESQFEDTALAPLMEPVPV